MKVSLDFTNASNKLFLPELVHFYNNIAQPAGWLILRFVVGGWLLFEGWPKLMDPMGQIGFVEMIGFRPGWLFSPLLAIMQTAGGLAIILGFYTRAFAFANAIMLFVTVWFHFNFPYNPMPFLTEAGIAALKDHPEFFTANGLKRLADGGLAFVDLTQHKAVQLSSIWGFACLFFAAFGGGILSLDRLFKKTI